MAPATKIKLLIDQVKISIEERNQLRQLGRTASRSDTKEIENSLKTIRSGLAALADEQAKRPYTDDETLVTERRHIEQLVDRFNEAIDAFGDDSEIDTTPYKFSLATNAGQDRPKTVKSVRFDDNLEAVQDERLFGRSQSEFVEPYRDDPSQSNNDLYQQQQVQMTEQDEHLDRLSQSVGRQHQLSIQIDDELGSHIQLLDDVEALTDRSQSRLEAAKKRLDKFSKQARENGSLLTIAILSLIFIILVVVLK